MTKLATIIQKNKALILKSHKVNEKGQKAIATAREILAKHSQPKKVYELFDWQLSEKGCTVTYFDQFDKEYEKFFSFEQLYTFIGDFYNNIIDRFENDEHVQYVDNQSAEDYFNENQSAVLMDFLKNAKF